MKNINTYAKYCPNVYPAKCTEPHQRGETITLATRRGKENEVVIYNLIAEKDGFYFYSFVRADGYNVQERAKQKAQRYQAAAQRAQEKSAEYCEAATEGKDFLSLAEPIKIGHHSERRHRALIERNHKRMSKAVEAAERAEEYADKAERWQEHENDINLSMPESLDFYAEKLKEAKEYHAGLKSEEYPKEHNYSMTYANKKVKELSKM